MTRIVSMARVATLLLLACRPAAGTEDPAVLTVRPATCVALHKGQPCFRSVRIAWASIEDDRRYCVLLDGRDTPLLCWRGSERTHHDHDFASATGERYRLVVGEDREPVARASVRTAWVYRSSRRGATGWRLF